MVFLTGSIPLRHTLCPVQATFVYLAVGYLAARQHGQHLNAELLSMPTSSHVLLVLPGVTGHCCYKQCAAWADGYHTILTMKDASTAAKAFCSPSGPTIWPLERGTRSWHRASIFLTSEPHAMASVFKPASLPCSQLMMPCSFPCR